MTQVLIDVIGVHAVATKNAPLTAGMVGVPVRFSFSPEWEELECLAVFRAGEVKKDNVLIDGCSVIPAEVMTQVGQTVYIGVEGRKRDGSIVFPTVWAEAGRILDGARASGDPALAPTPSQFDRLMGEMKRVDTTLRQTWEKLFPYGEAEEILPAMTAAVSAKEAELPKIQILPGETYLVSFNGQDYTIVAEEEENTQRIGKISEGVPFSIYNSQAKPNGTWLQVAKNLAEVNVALWRRGAPRETIDPKLLPAYGIGSGGTITQEQIDTAVAAYLENHPLPNGLNDEQITALDGMFRVAAYGKEDVSQAYEAFKNAFAIGGEEEPEAPHSHSYTSSVTKAATCTTAGVRTYTCPCGHSYTASIPATGHQYANGVCTVCGAADPNYKPDVPEVTLSGISATYSGGDVEAGTAVSALSGIVVTAHYSDGSTQTVTGYTLSGTIKEGKNTITVSYQGKTAAFTVTGVAKEEPHTHSYTAAVTKAATCTTAGVRTYTCPCGHSYTESIAATGHTYADGVCTSCGAADPNADDGTGWTANEAYTDYNWIDGCFVADNGGNGSHGDYSASGYMPCAGVSTLMSSQTISYGVFYDINKTYLSPCVPKAGERMSVPENAAFFRISGVSETVKTISIIPDYVAEVAAGWEDGVPYVFENWVSGYCMGTYVGSHDGFQTSDYMPCFGAATLESGTSTKYDYCAWYDADKKSISRFGFHSAALVQTVPENASYFRISKATGAADPIITPHA